MQGLSPKVVVLSDGGFRSAFVTCLAVKEFGADSTRLLHLHQTNNVGSGRLSKIMGIADFYSIPYTCLYTRGFGGVFDMTAQIFTSLSYASQIGFTKVYYGTSKPSKVSEFNYEQTYTHLRNIQLMIKSARHEFRYSSLPEPDAPAILLSPQQVMALCRSYQVPLKLTWNCEEDRLKPCGVCSKCLEWTALNSLRLILMEVK